MTISTIRFGLRRGVTDMKDVTSGHEAFQPNFRVLIRVVGVIYSSPGSEIRWTKAQNLAGMNSVRFNKYIHHCVAKRYVTIKDMGHRHRIIRLEERGKEFFETMKKFL